MRFKSSESRRFIGTSAPLTPFTLKPDAPKERGHDQHGHQQRAERELGAAHRQSSGVRFAAKKKIIAGTFNTVILGVPELAEMEAGDGTKRTAVMGGVHAGSPYAYLSITEIRGPTHLTLRFVDLEDNSVLLRTEFDISCNDPLATTEIVAPLPPLPVPHAGNYALELLAGSGVDLELIGSHRLRAIQFTSGENL